MFLGEFLFNASKLNDVKSIAADYALATALIKKAVAKVARRSNGRVKEANVTTYMHGSYANVTNIWFPSNLEIAVELNVPAYEFKIENDYWVAHTLPYSPEQFRSDLHAALREVAKTELPLTNKTLLLLKNEKLHHTVEIMPCITFKTGVLLYDDASKRDIVTYPRVHRQNGDLKDMATHGNFKRMVRLFKTLAAIGAREYQNVPQLAHKTRGYFIECLLFNVPNQIFNGENLADVFTKVLNYLLHANFRDFVCQNRVWQLFGAAAEFWNERDAHAFVGGIKWLAKNFPENREKLVANA